MICLWTNICKIRREAHRKIISNALDSKSSKKKNCNTTLNFLFHITYLFLPNENIRTLKKGREHNWHFLLYERIKTCAGTVLAAWCTQFFIPMSLDSSQDHLPLYSKMKFNWKGYLQLIQIFGGNIRSCIGCWRLNPATSLLVALLMVLIPLITLNMSLCCDI